MEKKTYKLPELEELKELLKETGNIIFYKRAGEWEGSEESKQYLKRKIKELEKLMDTGENNTKIGGIL